jgi:hypothetical protein
VSAVYRDYAVFDFEEIAFLRVWRGMRLFKGSLDLLAKCLIIENPRIEQAVLLQ